jgi:hypothetical protein
MRKKNADVTLHKIGRRDGREALRGLKPPQIHSPSARFACDNALYHTLDDRAGEPLKMRQMTTEIILAPSPDLQPAPFFTPTPKAAKRVLEFFTGQVNNDHTRRAYYERNSALRRLVRRQEHQ